MNATDQELLERFQSTGEPSSFEELVRRHLGLVRATAARIAGQQMLAEEAAQIVFTRLARVSALRPGVSVVAWLHRTTRSATLDLVKAEVRRSKREQIAASLTMNESYVPWERISPVLDQVIDGLSAEERHVVLCRYFEGQSHAQIAQSLNVSEDALRMRVTRALDKIRVLLQRRGITTTASALAMVLPAHALATPASAGLVASVTATALTSLAPSVGLLQIIGIVMTKKSASIVATLLILAGGGAVVYFTSQSHDPNAALAAEGRAAGRGIGTPSPTPASTGGPGGQTPMGGATGGPAGSENGTALPRRKEPTAEEAAHIAKYGDSRFTMAKQLTPTMLNLLGKDGIPAVMQTLGIQSKGDDMAYFTENYELTDEQKKAVSALYDKIQAQKREKFAADIAYLNENPGVLTERLLAGDGLKRGTISEAEFLDTVGKLDRRVWNLGLLIDSRAGSVDAGQLMAEDEFVTGFKKAIDPEWGDLIDQMLAENPQIAEARKERLAAESELPKAGNAESLEDIDKMVTALTKMVGTAKILMDDAKPALRKAEEGGGK